MNSTRTRLIPLSGDFGEGLFTLVDEADYDWLKRWRWNLSRKGGYAIANIGSRPTRNRLYMHKLLIEPPPGYVTDHINRNRLDNRRWNLRAVTRRENRLNSAQAEESYYRKVASGRRPAAARDLPRMCSVYQDASRGNIWRGCVGHGRKRRYIPVQQTPEDAVAAVLALYAEMLRTGWSPEG